MVPAWTLFALTAVFFIREEIMRSREKPTDYDSGYRQAIKDIMDKWNTLNRMYHAKQDNFTMKMKDFIQKKVDEVGL